MQHYVVHLKIFAGEYEKTAKHLVQAASPELAQEIAILDESHTPEDLEFTDVGVFDAGGAFAYRVKKITRVEPPHAAILSEYL